MKYSNSYSRGVSEFIFKKTKERQIKEKKRFFYLSNSTTCTTVVFSISRFICANVILLVENFHHLIASDWTKVANDFDSCHWPTMDKCRSRSSNGTLPFSRKDNILRAFWHGASFSWIPNGTPYVICSYTTLEQVLDQWNNKMIMGSVWNSVKRSNASKPRRKIKFSAEF